MIQMRIATPPLESGLDDGHLRDMLASPLSLQERERQVPTDHEFITPSEETQCQIHLTSEQETCSGVFSHKKVGSRVTFRQ